MKFIKTTRDDIASLFGHLAAILYFLCSIPQLHLNYKRHSTKGFSHTFVIMRIFSLSFLVSCSYVEKQPFPVQISGILLLFTSILSAIQISMYNRYYIFLMWLTLPAYIMFVSYNWPSTVEYTKWINPVFSLVSYLPLISTCIKARTTAGISVFAQHLNFIGSLFGLLMCGISEFCLNVNWVFYLIGIIQASIVFVVAVFFGEMRFFDSQYERTDDLPYVKITI